MQTLRCRRTLRPWLAGLLVLGLLPQGGMAGQEATPVPGTPCATKFGWWPRRRRGNLRGDCWTDMPITVPDGGTFDGQGHTIGVVDPPGGRFDGGVIERRGWDRHGKERDDRRTGLVQGCGLLAWVTGLWFEGAGGEILRWSGTHDRGRRSTGGSVRWRRHRASGWDRHGKERDDRRIRVCSGLRPAGAVTGLWFEGAGGEMPAYGGRPAARRRSAVRFGHHRRSREPPSGRRAGQHGGRSRGGRDIRRGRRRDRHGQFGDRRGQHRCSSLRYPGRRR